MKIKTFLLWILCCMIFLVACDRSAPQGKRGNDYSYTVVLTEDIPSIFKEEIDKKYINDFQMTYTDEEYLYLAVGYGEQNSGGYSIQVDGLYEQGADLCLATTLVGPEADQVVSQKPSYPYIVLKTKLTDREVVFRT